MPLTPAERQRRYRERHPDRVAARAELGREAKNAKQREARRADPEKHRASYKAQNDKRAAYRRDYYLRKNYGLGTLDYEAKLAEQGGMCAICGAEEVAPVTSRQGTDQSRVRYMPVDHDHTTGAARGILCTSCNVRLGTIEGWPHYESALAYIARYAVSRNPEIRG